MLGASFDQIVLLPTNGTIHHKDLSVNVNIKSMTSRIYATLDVWFRPTILCAVLKAINSEETVLFHRFNNLCPIDNTGVHWRLD